VSELDSVSSRHCELASRHNRHESKHEAIFICDESGYRYLISTCAKGKGWKIRPEDLAGNRNKHTAYFPCSRDYQLHSAIVVLTLLYVNWGGGT